MLKRSFRTIASAFALASLSFMFSSNVLAQDKKDGKKLTTAEVISKHLESIGTADAIAAAKTRVMMGTGTLVSKIKSANSIGGPAQFATQGDMLVFAMAFNASDYPYEKAAFDGENVTVGLPNGRRTALAEFIKAKSGVVKEGLFGGTLSSAWPLLAMDAKKVKLEYSGLSKFEGKQAHKIKYSPREGDLRVTLFFEPDTFRHVGSIYEYSIQPKMAAISTDSVSSQVTRFTLTEKFSDFRTADKLTLPFGYSITFSSQGQTLSTAASQDLEWNVKFENAYFNEKLDPGVFKVS
jgi:hypothetical protein